MKLRVWFLQTVYLRLCLFWVKIISGNEAVWLVRKILFSGNWNPLTEKKGLWPRKSITASIFTSKDFRKKRERERERACAREKTSPRRSPVRAPVRERIRPVRRRRSTLCEIAPSIAISRMRDRAVARSRRWSRSRLREIASARSRSAVEIAIARSGFVFSGFVFSGLWLVFFWIYVFLLLFQTPENIF